jgi:hypothetical protein
MVGGPADVEIVVTLRLLPSGVREMGALKELVRRSRVRRFATLGAAALVASTVAAPLAAQYVCRPATGSNEARTLAIFSVPLAFSPGAPPGSAAGVTIGFEAASVPNVDPATATPTTCRPGKGPENTDLLPAIARPRLGVPLPLGLALDASWIPPVRVAGVKANLIALALTRSFGHADGLAVAVRAHATFGSIRAPVTCDRDGLADPTSECFQGQVSDDRYSPNIMGMDVSVGWAMMGGRLRPYLGSGYNRLQPRFQVNFRNRFGDLDTTRLAVNLNRATVFGGAAWQLSAHLAVAGEIYAAPADAATGRFVVRRSIGP